MPLPSVQKVFLSVVFVNVLIICAVYVMRNGFWKPQLYFVRETPQSCPTLWWPIVEPKPVSYVNLMGYYSGNMCLSPKNWKYFKSLVQIELEKIQGYVKNSKKHHMSAEESHNHLLENSTYAEIGQFQQIDFTGGYVVSAFLDQRVEPSPDVKVLYIVPLTTPDLYCQTFCNGSYITVHGSPEFLYFFNLAHERCIWNQYVLHCHFPPDCDHRHVSVTSSPFLKPTNLLHITKTDAPYKAPAVFGVCLNHMFNLTAKQIPQITNFFETFLYFGGDVIYLYGHSNINAAVFKVLQYYVNKGVLQIYNWIIPPDVSSLFFFGQVLQNMDCAYRHIRQVQHLVFLDLDEALYPIQHSSYQELLTHLKPDTFTEYSAGVYLHRVNTYLPLTAYHPPSGIHSHPQPGKDKFCIEHWPKALIRPKYILTLGVHTIEQTLRPFHQGPTLDRNMAAVFHIRDHDISCTEDSKLDHQETRSMNVSVTKWFPQINSRAKKVLKFISDGH